MTISFIGHSDVDNPVEVQSWLNETVRRLCAQGAKTFLLGGYGSFDRMAAMTVWQVKPSFPDISSILVLPYIDKKADMTYYDDSLYPPLENVPRRYAIPKRNEWMVDAADIIVAYVLHGWGGAAKTFAYAKRRGKTIISYVEKDRFRKNLEGK